MNRSAVLEAIGILVSGILLSSYTHQKSRARVTDGPDGGR